MKWTDTRAIAIALAEAHPAILVVDRADREEGLAVVRCTGIVHRPQPPATVAKSTPIAPMLNSTAESIT